MELLVPPISNILFTNDIKYFHMTRRDQDRKIKIYKNVELFINNKIYLERLPRIRKEQQIPESGFKDRAPYIWHVYQFRKHLNIDRKLNNGNQPLDDDIEQLLIDMHRGDEWKKVAYNHIVFGEKTTETYSILRSNEVEGIVNMGPYIEKKSKTIRITIYPNTLQKDYVNAWKKIAEIQKTLPGYDRSRNRPALLSDLAMYKKPKQDTYQKQFQQLDDSLIRPSKKDNELQNRERGARRIKKELENGQ